MLTLLSNYTVVANLDAAAPGSIFLTPQRQNLRVNLILTRSPPVAYRPLTT